MGFNNFGSLVDACNNGKLIYSSWRKTPSQASTAGTWIDLSMSPGNPVPNYYASTPLIGSQINTPGLYIGGAVAPATRHLKTITALTTTAAATPLPLILCDYLFYYPFIDMSVVGEQDFDNTQSSPARYTNGNGVQIIAIEVASQNGGQSFFVTYTNSNGVSGRTTPNIKCNSVNTTGSLITTATAISGCSGPFLPLQNGDLGVQSIQSLTMISGDVGLITLVMVKPLASMMIRGIDAPVEVDFFKDRPSLPTIYDGAYLNFLAMPNGSVSGAPIYGDITTVWS